jgi:CheY-like chemotaxis protein
MPPLVLVVDDEADLIATYERVLRRQGHQVVAALTREQALQTLHSRSFALVIADLRLPDGDGLDVVRAARAAQDPTPAIVVTGYPSEAHRRQATAAGAAAFIAKPFSIVEFVNLVNRVVGPHPPQGSSADGHGR